VTQRVPGRIEMLWRVRIPGHRGHTFLVDPDSRSVFVSDVLLVAYPALRLHRLSLDTGDELAAVGTRSQAVGALAIGSGRLWVSTQRRLFALDPRTLDVLDQWDKGLINDTATIVPDLGRGAARRGDLGGARRFAHRPPAQSGTPGHGHHRAP